MTTETTETISTTDQDSAQHWHSGHNMPGYMPENDVWTHATFEDAVVFMVEDLEHYADATETWVDEHDCDDIPCPTYGDDCAWNKAQNTRALVEDLLHENTGETEWTGYDDGLAWWIVECNDAACVEAARELGEWYDDAE